MQWLSQRNNFMILHMVAVIVLSLCVCGWRSQATFPWYWLIWIPGQEVPPLSSWLSSRLNTVDYRVTGVHYTFTYLIHFAAILSGLSLPVSPAYFPPAVFVLSASMCFLSGGSINTQYFLLIVSSVQDLYWEVRIILSAGDAQSSRSHELSLCLVVNNSEAGWLAVRTDVLFRL